MMAGPHKRAGFGTILVLSSMLILGACDSKKVKSQTTSSTSSTSGTPIGAILWGRAQALSDAYQLACKNGNEDAARNDLLAMTTLANDLNPEDRKGLDPSTLPGINTTAYVLLFYLDRRIGQEDFADADFIKARSWRLQFLENNGASEKDALRQVMDLKEDNLNLFSNLDASKLIKATFHNSATIPANSN